MRERYIIVRIDDIAEILKDYAGPEDLPANAKPVKLMLKPTERGKLALLMDSDDWQGDLPPLAISFKIKRVFSV